MQDIWKSRDQIKVHQSGDMIPRLDSSSTPDAWAKTGRDLFERKKYRHAMSCFERADLTRERDIAEAFYLRENAQKPKDYVRASAAFETVANGSLADRVSYLCSAAKCLIQADRYLSAAKLYYSAEQYDDSIRCYLKKNAFDDIVHILHQGSVSGNLAEQAREKAKLHYLHNGRSEYVPTLVCIFHNNI